MKFKVTTPSEEIIRTDHLATIFNSEKMLRDGKFLVDLACGHKHYTRAQKKSVCPRCTEMLKRSIKDGKEDYESFRKGLRQDTMVWLKDPCRRYNESTDLSGNFKD